MANSTDALHERTARLAADPSLQPHGVLGTYTNWGCRCPDCTEARRRYDRTRPARRAAKDFQGEAPDDRREKLRKMGFAVNDPAEDVI